ncbi:MAG: hypothetical protein KME13_23935 [Myxacorys californica WJT36-NPBG1]|nr:hypothetical protein [Myxacorys californica WJT36-NPBG1]
MTDRITATAAIARWLAFDYKLHDILLKCQLHQDGSELTINCPSSEILESVLLQSQSIAIVALNLELAYIKILNQGYLEAVIPTQLATVQWAS